MSLALHVIVGFETIHAHIYRVAALHTRTRQMVGGYVRNGSSSLPAVTKILVKEKLGDKLNAHTHTHTFRFECYEIQISDDKKIPMEIFLTYATPQMANGNRAC